MPFRLPFPLGSSTRRERTPRSGGRWWRRSRSSVATTSADVCEPVSSSSGQSQPHTHAQVTTSSPPSSYSIVHSHADPQQELTSNAASSSQVTCDGNNGNDGEAPRGDGQHTLGAGLTQNPLPSLSSTTHVLGMSQTHNPAPSIPVDTIPHPPMSGNPLPSSPPTGAGTGIRSNLIIPIIVIGLQHPTAGWESPHPAHFHDPLHHHHQHFHGRIRSIDDEDDALEISGLPDALNVPRPLSSSLGDNFPFGPPTGHRDLSSQANSSQDRFLPAQAQQSPQPRTWQNRTFDVFRNLIRTRQNGVASTTVTGETLASQTLLIYVIGGFSSNEHHVIMGGNLDSFEALWELAEFLGQVKPPTASREDIERSGLEVVQSSSLEEYEKTDRIASNCIERCLICLEDYAPEEHIRVLTCKHAFHQPCVDRWLETGRNNCPACRSKGVENTGSESSTAPEASASASRSTS